MNDAQLKCASKRANTTGAPMKAAQQTAQDAYWTAHSKALELSHGTHGTFAALIGDAFTRADSTNAARLISAFPELFA